MTCSYLKIVLLLIMILSACTEHGGYDATIKEYQEKYSVYDCSELKSAYDEIAHKSNNSWKKPVIWQFIRNKCN